MDTVKITLNTGEYRALVQLCKQELRPVPDQVRQLVREGLRGRGLLPISENSHEPNE